MTLVGLNELWRQRSRLAPSEISTEDEDTIWSSFNEACAAALKSRTGKLSRRNARKWQQVIDSATKSLPHESSEPS